MRTIQIAADITATVTFRTFDLYQKAMKASENARLAVQNEAFDWEDIQDFWLEESEAWEKLLS